MAHGFKCQSCVDIQDISENHSNLKMLFFFQLESLINIALSIELVHALSYMYYIFLLLLAIKSSQKKNKLLKKYNSSENNYNFIFAGILHCLQMEVKQTP